MADTLPNILKAHDAAILTLSPEHEIIVESIASKFRLDLDDFWVTKNTPKVFSNITIQSYERVVEYLQGDAWSSSWEPFVFPQLEEDVLGIAEEDDV